MAKARAKGVDNTTVQILDGEGKPLTDKMPLGEMKERMDRATAAIGHNSGEVSADRLRSFVRRIEKLGEDRDAVNEDIKEVYAEAKGTGFDTKTIRKIIAERKVSVEKRREQAELLDLYKSAIGMLDE